MVGRLNGLVTRMACEAEHHILHIRCPPHQMDVIVKDGAEMLYDGKWSKQVWSMSVYLRSQANLITRMNVKCPKRPTVGSIWACCSTSSSSIAAPLIQHMMANASDKRPLDQWWVIAYAIAPAIEEINKTFVMSQSRSLFIAQQKSLIQMLIDILVAMFGIVHADNADDDGDEFETFEQWHIERAELILYVKDQGSFPKSCYERLDAPTQKEFMSQLARYAMFIVIGLNNICAKCDENNEPLEQDAPPVMPN
ncbi:unnamed protein product [Sphagnum jensenii]|uniref:Transposase n=1 Tax=Sphagnum jensenii TaxID=128206 RepID=A0ABP0XB43_9BRYO